jgi:hypothetical protein
MGVKSNIGRRRLDGALRPKKMQIALDQIGSLSRYLGDPFPAIHMAAGGSPAFEGHQDRDSQRLMGGRLGHRDSRQFAPQAAGS